MKKVIGHSEVLSMDKSEQNLKINEQTINRFGAALFFLVGSKIGLDDLSWALPTLGAEGDKLLFDDLKKTGAINKHGVLLAIETARWLLRKIESSHEDNEGSQLVWTLPSQHPECGLKGSSYKEKIVEVINFTENELILISPFLAERGVSAITQSILSALHRCVTVIIITHSVKDISSDQSLAIEELRREAHRMSASLSIYTSPQKNHHLLHAKLCISDRQRLVLGSANITGQGLHEHFEAGTILGIKQAEEAAKVVSGLIESGLAKKII